MIIPMQEVARLQVKLIFFPFGAPWFAATCNNQQAEADQRVAGKRLTTIFIYVCKALTCEDAQKSINNCEEASRALKSLEKRIEAAVGHMITLEEEWAKMDIQLRALRERLRCGTASRFQMTIIRKAFVHLEVGYRGLQRKVRSSFMLLIPFKPMNALFLFSRLSILHYIQHRSSMMVNHSISIVVCLKCLFI